jgi:hypothetical protein
MSKDTEDDNNGSSDWGDRDKGGTMGGHQPGAAGA